MVLVTMAQKNSPFRYPPPPPPNYIPNIIPPLPTENPPVAPPPPPPTTAQNWSNWTVDFSRPPPAVYNRGLNSTNTANNLNLGYNVMNSTVPTPSISPANSVDSSSYYRTNSMESLQYLTSDNRQFQRYNSDQYSNGSNNQGWTQRTSFKRPRYESRTDQRNELHDGYNKYNNDLKSGRSPSTLDSRYPRDANNLDLKNNRLTEEGQRSRKRKKPLSQSVPAKKAWTDGEAQKAIDVEKHFNKNVKNHSLKIKFPDPELNRDIVSGFSSSIDTIYFQQPSNARFCFVTLKEGSDPTEVIEQINKTPFGQGFLAAEYKKDREEEQNVGPEDIDPLTLYVGNLAQEVTKEDMVSYFPKNKRIDIGFAKKMRYTRYAFVSFKNVKDSIEAFQQNHNRVLHNKSMIVRFRRLHGTVGMPGEAKSQNLTRESQAEKRKEEDISGEKQSMDYSESTTPTESEEHEMFDSPPISQETGSSTCQSPSQSLRASSESSEISNKSEPCPFNLNLVKTEPCDDHESEVSVDCSSLLDSNPDPVPDPLESPGKPDTEPPDMPVNIVVKQEPEFRSPFLPENAFPIRPMVLKEEPIENNEEEPSVHQPQSSSSRVNEEISASGILKRPKTEIVEDEEKLAAENEAAFNDAETDFDAVFDHIKRRKQRYNP